MTKKPVVRVECPPEVSRAVFLATALSWLDHQCIMVTELRSAAEAGSGGVFEAEFDNPREAHLFARRFGAEPIHPHIGSRPGGDHLRGLFQFWRKSVAKTGAHPVGPWAATEAPAK